MIEEFARRFPDPPKGVWQVGDTLLDGMCQVLPLTPEKLYAEGGVDLTRNIYPDSVYNRAQFYLCPGIEYSLTDHWALMGSLGRLEYDTYSRAFALGLDAANFSFGVYYSF